MAGLILSQFRTNFPEFVSVQDSIINGILDVINYGYNLISNNVTDTGILNIYYYLVAHFVSVSTNSESEIGPPGGSYMPESSTTSKVSDSFAKIDGLTADMSFMLSTRYGQVFYFLSKQLYIQRTYLSLGTC